MKGFLSLAWFLALTIPLSAQMSLTTTLASGNGQNGAMFDITNVSSSPVVITGFDQAFFGAGTATLFEIYTVTAGTTFVGNEANASAWTLQGSTPNLAHPAAAPAVVSVPIALSVPIAPGQSLGFYLTTNTDTIAYTNGASAVGTVFASDAFLQFHIGIGKAYPFGTAFTPRVWNGIIRYAASGATPLWQTNSPPSTLTLNGVNGTSFTKARSTSCGGAAVTANSLGTPGQGFEVAFNVAPTVSATTPGSFITGFGQIVNLDLTAGVYFLFGGILPSFTPHPGTLPAVFGAPFGTVSMQQLVFDPANPEGVTLSQACQLDAGLILPTLPVAGPAGDDTEIAVNVGCVRFFGTSFTQLFIESNGRLIFGNTGNTTYTPSAAQFALDGPSFGVWNDLNPSVVTTSGAGSISLTSPAAGVINVAYVNVAYFGTTTPNNFQLQLDTNNGIVSIIGLGGLAAGTGQMLIGISGGSAVTATDPGATAFSPGGAGSSGTSANATAMLYALGTQGSVTTGINRIDFIPNPQNNYDWVSQ